MVARDILKKASARTGRQRENGPIALAARYDRRSGRVVVGLSSGIEVMFSPQKAQGLEDAKPAQLDTIEISPSGLGLRFPKLDADLYLPALLDGWLGSRRWMAARMGERGGRVRSEAKRTASRENGKLDADLYLPALLDGWLGSGRWMAARTGERGGRVRSEAKRTASRENGKLGGRPRKAVRG